MKVSKIVIAAALSSLAAMSTHAEQYQGVLEVRSTHSRDAVRSEAVAAAHSPNPYAEGASAGMPLVTAGELNRRSVHAEAVATARIGDPYAEARSAGSAARLASSVDRATVRAQARAAARSDTALAL